MAVKGIKKQVSKKAGVLLGKAKEQGSKALDGAKVGARIAADAAQDGRQKLRTAHYNPVFPEEYASPDFDMPKMVIIEDEDVRKGIDVCEGSIGWLSTEKGLEVLHLYEEAIPVSGLHFHPSPLCDTAYFLDSFHANRYVNLSKYFEVIQKDKMSELLDIAHSLGAKSCRLETYEMEKAVSMKKGNANGKVKGKVKGQPVNVQVCIEAERASQNTTERKVLTTQAFEGEAEPKRPQLNWYRDDVEINRLIEARCSGDGRNETKEYHIEIDSSASSTMSTKMAGKIDGALKALGADVNFTFKGEVLNESRCVLIFNIVF